MLDIQKVEIAETLRDGVNASLDAPAVGPIRGIVFRVAGWFRLPRGSTAPKVRLHLAACAGAEPLHWELRTLDCQPRADIPCHDWEAAFGFDGYVDAVRLPRTFRVLITYRGDTDEEFALGEISGQRTFISAQHGTRFQPIAVYHGGRMGSTAMMRALLAHPEIVVGDKHPFENNTVGYLAGVSMSVLRTASRSNDAEARWEDMRGFWDRYGPNSSLSPDFQDHASIETTLELLSRPVADFARSSIDRSYDLIARRTKKSRAGFFAEKETRPDTINALLWLYPQVKLILLTRDPRDVVRSARDFNAKRGQPGFGREFVDSDEDWIDLQGRLLCSFVDVFDNHPAADRLHVSFEEFTADARAVLRRVCEFLGVDRSPARIKAMEHAVREETPESRLHRTRPRGKEVGGWHESLPPAQARRLVRRAGAFMQRFGYHAGPDQGEGDEVSPGKMPQQAPNTHPAKTAAEPRGFDDIVKQRDEMVRVSEEAVRAVRAHELRVSELTRTLNEVGRHATGLTRERDEALKFATSLKASLETITQQATAERQARQRLQADAEKYVAGLKAAIAEHHQAWQAVQAQTQVLKAEAISERKARERLQAESDKYLASLKAQIANHDQAWRASQGEVESLRAQAAAERAARERLQGDAEKYIASLKAQMAGYEDASRALQAEVESLRAQAIAEREARERLQSDAETYIASLKAQMADYEDASQALQGEVESLRAQAIAEREARERLQAESDEYIASLKAGLAEHDQALQAARMELAAFKAAIGQPDTPPAEA